MKNRVIILASLLGMSILSGCASLYDDNESYQAVELYHNINNLECSDEGLAIEQAAIIDDNVDWLIAYSELKGSRDVNNLLLLMKTTTEPLAARESMSPTYCGLKKTLLQEQSRDVGTAILRRNK
jgi:outer membrane murein-binding lipoprotein Lpp